MINPESQEGTINFVDRIIDRFLPPVSAPKKLIDKILISFSTVCGTLTWTVYQFSQIQELWIPEGGFLIFSILAMSAAGIFAIIINNSFERGTPLSFFFWGLIFPTLAARILTFGSVFGK